MAVLLNERSAVAAPRNSSSNRKKFVVKKKKPPAWVLVTFFGLPAVLIVVLSGMIVKNVFFSNPCAKPKSSDNPEEVIQRAEKLRDEAQRLKRKAYKWQREGKNISGLIQGALEKFKKARDLYGQIVEKVKKQHDGKIPPEFQGYEKERSEIQQAIGDTVKMSPMY